MSNLDPVDATELRSDGPIPVMRAFTEFERSMEAVFDLMAFHSEHLPRLDSKANRFRKSVKQWNPRDTDEAIDAIFEQILQFVGGIKNDSEGASEQILNAIYDAVKANSVDAESYWILYYRDSFTAINQRPRSAKMREALLTSAVGAFDVLMTDIMLAYACLKPESMFESDRKYKLCDIAKHPNIESLVRQHAVQFVHDKGYASVADWFVWLGKTVNLPITAVTTRTATFQEIFLRRNNIVHAGGRVNTIYLDKLPNELIKPKLNSRLNVNKSYLSGACEILLAAGMAAYVHFLHYYESRQPAPADVGSLISNNSFRLLTAGHNIAVEEYASCVWDLCKSTGPDHLRVLQVNRWIAQKALGRHSYRSEVDAWDVSRLHRRFELAKLALLDQAEAGIALANDLVARSELQVSDWYDWPLLEPLRKYAEEHPGQCTFS